jgi:hypothetical protein
VIKVIEDTPILSSSSSSDNNNNAPPLNAMEVLLTAVIDENVHFDCMYFLLRSGESLIF